MSGWWKWTSIPRRTTRATCPARIAWAWNTQLCDTVRRDILSQEQFEELMSASGVTPDTTLVIYGDNNNWFAAWAFWQAKIYGHSDVRLMNGGRKKWLAEGRELSNDVPAGEADSLSRPGAGPFPARLSAAGAGGFGATDARPWWTCAARRNSPGEILAPPGLPETCQRGGHIPGARNIPWGKACNDDGTFKSADELRALYRRRRHRRVEAGDRLLPHRRALQPHLVRAEVPAGSTT